MKVLKKIALWTGLVVTGLAAALVITVFVLSNRKYEAPYPDIQSSTDPAVIERGRYLAYGPGGCVNCHTPNSEGDAVRAGATPPLAGGHHFRLPLGTVYSPNLTPHPELGIGRYTDRELARVVRYGVMPDGRAALPFMEKQNISDDDLTALISFLRSQTPVARAVPDHEFNFLGKAVLAFVIRPIGPSGPVLKHAPAADGSVRHGEYLAAAVASCAECHTKRDRKTGQHVGARFAGGMEFSIADDKEHVLITPNLTPAKVGRITSWSEDQFVGRFGAGVGLPGTAMPWKQFQRMSDTDLRAVYRFLRSLEPVEVDPGPSKQKRKA